MGVLESYVMHRELRERQILGLLVQERDGGRQGLSPLAIVRRIYDSLPSAVSGRTTTVLIERCFSLTCCMCVRLSHHQVDAPPFLPFHLSLADQSPPTSPICAHVSHSHHHQSQKHPASAPQVVMSAQWNVEHHLDKLQKEGKASSSGLGLWRATPRAAVDT